MQKIKAFLARLSINREKKRTDIILTAEEETFVIQDTVKVETKPEYKLLSDADEHQIEQLLAENKLSYGQVGELASRLRERIATLENENLNILLSIKPAANDLLIMEHMAETRFKEFDDRLNDHNLALNIVRQNITDIETSCIVD